MLGSTAPNRCVVTELRRGSRQTYRESAPILKLPLCELEVTYLVNGERYQYHLLGGQGRIEEIIALLNTCCQLNTSL